MVMNERRTYTDWGVSFLPGFTMWKLPNRTVAWFLVPAKLPTRHRVIQIPGQRQEIGHAVLDCSPLFTPSLRNQHSHQWPHQVHNYFSSQSLPFVLYSTRQRGKSCELSVMKKLTEGRCCFENTGHSNTLNWESLLSKQTAFPCQSTTVLPLTKPVIPEAKSAPVKQ